MALRPAAQGDGAFLLNVFFITELNPVNVAACRPLFSHSWENTFYTLQTT